MTAFRPPPMPCPACGANVVAGDWTLEQYRAWAKPGRAPRSPEILDALMCASCDQLFVIGEDRRLRRPTADELAKIHGTCDDLETSQREILEQRRLNMRRMRDE